MFFVLQTVGWYVTGGIVSGMRAERSRRAALAALAALFALGPCSAELEITTPIPFGKYFKLNETFTTYIYTTAYVIM